MEELIHEKNFRYRVLFQKRGEQRLLSHLEMIHLLRDSLEKAAVPVAYDRGLRPKQEISFGPALPMHVESKEEFMDLFTYRFIHPEEIVARVNQFIPAGLFFCEAAQISRNASSLSVLIDGADYSVDPVESNDVEKGIEDFEHRNEILFTKHKSEKTVDLKKFVRAVHYDENQHRIFVEMKIIDGVTVGIQRIARLLCFTQDELPATRERLYIWDEGCKQSPIRFEWEQLQARKRYMDLMT